MSRTLNFVQHLWDRGQNLRKLGQNDAAFRVFDRLVSAPELPEDISADAHLRLAEMHLEAGRYKKARRKLAALLTVQPDHAQAHHLMACACEEDDTCPAERALKHYRKCAQLDPDNPDYWCDLGGFALFMGEREMGLRALRRAEKLAPDDPNILGLVAEGLREEDENAEAGQFLRNALFRNSKDQRFHDLWARHQFRLLQAQQQRNKLADQRVNLPPTMILPFPPPPKRSSIAGKQIRHDGPSGIPVPKMPRGSRIPQKKKM
jgi:tetratricopeptide (TPR) repeat protein